MIFDRLSFLQGKEVDKATFFAFFQGEQLRIKIKKICFGFHASLYPCQSNSEEADKLLQDINTRIEDMNMVS